MEIIISIAAKIAEYTVAPVGQWLCYSCHYSKNMENLKNQEKKLKNAKDRWKQSVDDALRKGEKIRSDVDMWLIDASRILREGEEKPEAWSTHATCLNLKQRHRLSREANKIARNIVKHLENGNFNTVSCLPAAQDLMVTTRHKNYVTLESRTSVANEVMEALGDANINKIGVWGMPGVGKSILMKEIDRRAKEEKLFHGVVLAAVTERPELSRIRGEIAVMLNQERHRQQTEIGRANLEQESSTKDAKLLVILDDIWPKQLELEDIGIPSEGCKVVLTSRNRDVLAREMGTQKTFELKSLVEEEAWNLFEKMAGDSVKDPDVREVAIKVAKECAGLPVALTTVSKALKGKSLSRWKDAVLQLKRPPPVDAPEILSPIYSCIELSYNHLADEELKSFFLLCTLLRQFKIDYQDLLRYGFGLGLFQGIVTLEEARHRLDSLVSNLQDSCLLLESSNTSGQFYMHDVVRYVATIIGSKDRNMFATRDNGDIKAWPDSLKRCQAFSILGGDIDQLPNEMECPELRFFHLCLENRSLHIQDSFFQGMDKLNVLYLMNTQLSSLPSSFLRLGNLQTLCLDQCVSGDISGIGKLKNLEILSFFHSNISKLPNEIGLLDRLRLLDLSNCSKLEMIPPNVISSLVKLEELYMRNSFIQWEFEGLDERKNASLDELKNLSNLTTLEIQIPDANNLPKDLMFEKLERYTICIGDVWDWIGKRYQCSRALKLKLNSKFQSKFWIKMLLKTTDNLQLDELDGVKSVIPEIDKGGFQQLKHLRIQNNAEIKQILNLRTPIIAFPTLETFVLENMISLKEICHGKLRSTSFKNLRVLKVKSCDKLRYVFSSSIAGGLPLLEELEVKSCNNMGAIVVKEEEDGIEDRNLILFHQLHTLVLQELPKLMSFLSTKDSFVADCGEIIAEGNHDIHMPLLHHQVAFPSLKSLIIKGLPKIKHVRSLKSFFPTSVISHLEQLRMLSIDDCGVEEIVAYEGGREAVLRFVFPQVTILDLRNLYRLKWFYKGVHVSKWPMLKGIRIRECEKVKIFASGVVNFQETVEERQSEMSIEQPLFLVEEHSFPSLEILYIEHMDMLEIIWQDQVTASSFSNIQLLRIDCCQKLLHVFPSNLLTTTFMQSLSMLRIAYCNSLETIFEKLEAGQNGKDSQALIALKSRTTEESVMREDGGAARHFVLPTLHHVELIQLPKLKWILKGEHTLEWPSLKELRLWDCEQVVNMIFAVKECTFPNLEILSLRDFNRTIRPSKFSDFHPSFLTRMPNLLVLEFDVYGSGSEEIFPYELLDAEVQVLIVPRLRRLEVFRLPMLAHLWKEDTQPCPLFYNLEFLKVSECGKLRILMPSLVYLQNLTDLDVSNCHGLINLVTSSTARTLLQLKKMTISKCKKITKIVAMEDGEANVAITFNKLTYLELDGLPNLTNFCSGAYSFGFPSLEKVIVSCCPEMKTFCQGILSTPKLKGVQATKDYSHWEGSMTLIPPHLDFGSQITMILNAYLEKW
ncbi:hypothetical protein I3760_06G074700 [Carya illinoinensis]|nr:hypothetical protein I3760_06G074700 [Carya illinoinensis]